MKTLIIKILFISCLFSSLAVSAPKLKLAKEFNLIAINGAEYESGFFDSAVNVNLRNGVNRLVIEFEELYEGEDDDSFDVIKSGYFLLQFNVDNKVNVVQQITRPSDADSAKRYIKNPTFSLILQNAKNTSINFSLTPLSSDKLIYALAQTQIKQRKTLDLSYSANAQTKKNAQPKKQLPKQSTASQMLKYWWSQASNAEKQAFLKEINQSND